MNVRDRRSIETGGTPGLVVIRGDSCSKGHEFESWHLILNGHFFKFFCWKIVIYVWKDENKWKRGRGWPIFYKKLKLKSPMVLKMVQRGGFFNLILIWRAKKSLYTISKWCHNESRFIKVIPNWVARHYYVIKVDDGCGLLKMLHK